MRTYVFFKVFASLMILHACWPRIGIAAHDASARMEEIAGIWDAVVPDEPRVFTIELHADGPSYVAMVVGRKSLVISLFKCIEATWRMSRLQIQCAGMGDASQYALEVLGRGSTIGGEGQIDAVFFLRSSARKRTHTRWHATLVNLNGNYIEWLSKMKQLGGAAIAAERKTIDKRK